MMSSDVTISVDKVGKKFCRSLKRTIVYGIRDVARDIFGIPTASTILRRDEFWALKDVSFEVKKGDCLGLLGANGAGKSTLLKLLNGVILPDEGTISTHGRVGALLELGAGFHPMLTGRENIHLNAAILGLSKEQIDDKFDAIVDLAGLKDFIDSPVKFYSSGMYVRLGFAVAAHIEPDILLIDETLAVGDVLFQTKCFAKLKEFKKKGTTIIFVTHTLDLIISFCDRAIVLNHGQLVSEGSPKAAVDKYNRIAATNGRFHQNQNMCSASDPKMLFCPEEVEWKELFTINPNENRFGSRKVEILEAGIFTLDDTPAQVLERNREYVIRIKLKYNESMQAAIVAHVIKDSRGTTLCGTNTAYQNVEMGWMEREDVTVVNFRQVIRLNPGEYLLCVGAASHEDGGLEVYDKRFDYMSFRVVSARHSAGIFDSESLVDWVHYKPRKSTAVEQFGG